MVKLKHIHFGQLEEFLECITLKSGYKAVVEIDTDPAEDMPHYNKSDVPHYNISILSNGGVQE